MNIKNPQFEISAVKPSQYPKKPQKNTYFQLK